MARNSSGTFTYISTPAVPGPAIPSSTTFNNVMADLANEVTDSLDRSGKGAMLASLDHGGFTAINAADSTLPTALATVQQAQKDVLKHAVTVAGTVDAIQLTFTPTTTTWTTNEKIRFKSAGANTSTTPTISKDGGVTNITVVKGSGVALVAGDIGASGTMHELVYNGTTLTLLNPAAITGYASLTAPNTFTSTQSFNAGPILQGTANQGNGTELMRIYANGKNGSGGAVTFNSIINWVYTGTAGSETAGYIFQSKINGVDVNAWWTGASGGWYAGTATGGDKGLGTGNFTGLYVNGVAVSSSATPHITVLTSGTTWTTNAATKWTKVTVIGAGGGGNGTTGGGGGGAATRVYTNLAPSTAYTIAVGAGGVSGGGNGGNTTFTDGTTLITGGGGASAGGAGGTATNGQINIVGNTGTTTIGGGSASGYGPGSLAGTPSSYGGGSFTNATAGATGAIIIEEWY
jgi:hypothetical protein